MSEVMCVALGLREDFISWRRGALGACGLGGPCTEDHSSQSVVGAPRCQADVSRSGTIPSGRQPYLFNLESLRGSGDGSNVEPSDR